LLKNEIQKYVKIIKTYALFLVKQPMAVQFRRFATNFGISIQEFFHKHSILLERGAEQAPPSKI
jgi:hypothetical protein